MSDLGGIAANKSRFFPFDKLRVRMTNLSDDDQTAPLPEGHPAGLFRMGGIWSLVSFERPT